MIATKLNEDEILRLSRTTLWRYKKRGWVRALRAVPRPFVYALSDFNAEFRTAYSKCFWFDYPNWITKDDLKQECYLQIIKLSGDSRISRPGFRVVVMRRRMADLSKKHREDDSYEGQHAFSLR